MATSDPDLWNGSQSPTGRVYYFFALFLKDEMPLRNSGEKRAGSDSSEPNQTCKLVLHMVSMFNAKEAIGSSMLLVYGQKLSNVGRTVPKSLVQALYGTRLLRDTPSTQGPSDVSSNLRKTSFLVCNYSQTLVR